MANKAELIRALKAQVEALEEELETDRAEEEEQGFSGEALKLYREHGELTGNVKELKERLGDLPTKSWVWRLLLAVAVVGILALGAAANWLRVILDLVGGAPTPPPGTGL